MKTKINGLKFDKAKIGEDISLMLTNDFFPPASEKFLYSKIVPEFSELYGKYAVYALCRTKKAMKDMIAHNFRLYLIEPEQFFPTLYQTLKEKKSAYNRNVKAKLREKTPEKEDVDSLFDDFLSKVRD